MAADAVTITRSGGTAWTTDQYAGYLVWDAVNTPDRGARAVRFFGPTGENSFAHDDSGSGTDASPDGICQACHFYTASPAAWST